MDRPLDFSNESFNAFQEVLSAGLPSNSLVWHLRDGLFGELTHSRPEPGQAMGLRDRLLTLPCGWLCYVASRLLSRRVPIDDGPSASHVLFLSARSNHRLRAAQALGERLVRGSATGWTIDGFPQEKLPDGLRPHLRSLGNRWLFGLRVSDFAESLRSERELSRLFPNETQGVRRQRVRLYTLGFLGWRRFWEGRISTDTEFVLTTYEKDPCAKALLGVAKENNVAARIHWAHGLPHNSQQSTFASEMWCLTPPDVSYFGDVLPEYCTPKYKPSPEGLELAGRVGTLHPDDRTKVRPVHFLVLGPGCDPLYTSSDQVADLKVIAIAKRAFGDAIRWRFRPHPGNVPAFVQALTEAGLEGESVSTGPLDQDIAWAHAVGSAFSSVVIDAGLCGRTMFWTHESIRSLYSVDRLIAAGFGIHLGSENIVSRFKETFGLEVCSV